MRLHELIVEKAVVTELGAATKKKAIARLVTALKEAGRLTNHEEALRDLLATERTGSTGTGQGVALPHACTAAVHQPLIAFGKSSAGIDFKAIDGGPVSLIFLVLGRSNGESLQLRIIARLAHVLNMPGSLEALARVESAGELKAFLMRVEEELGDIDGAEDIPTVCVAGAGNGGLAMAGHLALTGCRVNLFNRREKRLQAVKLSGGIQVTGEVSGFAKLNLVTTDPREALSHVDLVMVAIPATGHRDMARLLGPHLVDGQVVVLNPGRTGGALEVAETLRQMKIGAYYILAEAETLIYACRITNPGQVRIFGIKNAVPVATLPAYHIPDVLATFKKVLPQFIPGDNVLKTSLSNIGAVFHPALTVLNVAWIEERRGDFEYYHEGASPSTAKVLEQIDAERVKVAAAIGTRVLTAREWLYQAYGVTGDNLYEAMQANKGYRGIRAPNTLDHRYIWEDVPTSLVPIASLAGQLGVEVPTIRAIIHLSSILHRRNYISEGRTVERLGLAGLSVKQIRRLVEEGRK